MIRPFGDEVDRQKVLLGPERARDADEDLLVPGLHDAGGGDGVLGLQRGDQRGAVDPEAGQLLGRELNINALVLGPEDVDLGDVRQLEQLLADVVHVVPQLPVGEPVRGEAVDDAVGVAELVVEERGRRMPCGSVLRMSRTFLRTWYQMSGTSAGGVESFR